MIPTEPIGSIPRPPDLIAAVVANGGNSDAPALEPLFDAAIRDTIARFEAPDRDGYQFMREVRGLGPAGRVPAIALTAFARSEDRTRAMLAGYQVHMSKPIEPQELVATIKSLTGHVGDREH